jgi:hypothetical protein
MNARHVTLGCLPLWCVLAGCPNPNSKTDAGSSTPDASTTPDAGVGDAGPTPDAGGAVRSVVTDARLFGRTSVNNLLLDPLFTGLYSSSFAFIPLEVDGNGIDGTYAFPFDIATPSGTPGLVGLNRTNRARVMALALFNGGQGPFRADVWVSLDSQDETMVFSGEDVEVRVGAASLDGPGGADVHQLTYVPGDDRLIGARTWYHHVGAIAGALPASSVFLVESKIRDVDLLMAGPQVLPEALMPSVRPGARQVTAPQARKSAWNAVQRDGIRKVADKAYAPTPPPHLRMEALKRKLQNDPLRRMPPR